jgi:putative exporter of polyketide antibiotics
MNIPVISFITMIFAAISVIVSLAVLLVVLCRAPSQRVNRLMALYALTVALLGISYFGAPVISAWRRPDPFLYASGLK